MSEGLSTEQLVELAAQAAFFQDDLGGHIKGRWTYETIPEQGRENYRKMVRAVLEAALPAIQAKVEEEVRERALSREAIELAVSAAALREGLDDYAPLAARQVVAAALDHALPSKGTEEEKQQVGQREPWAGVANIAWCPEHGLHGARSTCFECGRPVEQIPMVPVAELESIRGTLRSLAGGPKDASAASERGEALTAQVAGMAQEASDELDKLTADYPDCLPSKGEERDEERLLKRLEEPAADHDFELGERCQIRRWTEKDGWEQCTLPAGHECNHSMQTADEEAAKQSGVCPVCEGHGGGDEPEGHEDSDCEGSCPGCWCPGCHDGHDFPESRLDELDDGDPYGSWLAYELVQAALPTTPKEER